jgi:hypothetical protein
MSNSLLSNKKIGIQNYLEQTRMTDKYYSKKQPNKIQLSFPKDFNRRLDDVLGKMSSDYQDVL